jgi:hypothetical protein
MTQSRTAGPPPLNATTQHQIEVTPSPPSAGTLETAHTPKTTYRHCFPSLHSASPSHFRTLGTSVALASTNSGFRARRYRRRTLTLSQQCIESLPIDQLNIPSSRKLLSILAEGPRRHDITAGRSLGRHHSVQFSHHRHAHRLRTPLLALHQKAFVAFGEHQIAARQPNSGGPDSRPGSADLASGPHQQLSTMAQGRPQWLRATHRLLSAIPNSRSARWTRGAIIHAAPSSRRRENCNTWNAHETDTYLLGGFSLLPFIRRGRNSKIDRTCRGIIGTRF